MTETPTQLTQPSLRSGRWLNAHRLVLGLSIAALGLFGFSLLGRYSFYAEILGNFRYLILGTLLLGLMLLCCLRSWKWAALLSLAVIWCMNGVVSVYLPISQPAAGRQQIRLMSFNVWAGNDQASRVLEKIRSADPDLLVVVEYANHWSEMLEELNETYPYRVLQPRWHGFGLALFSKYPLEQTTIHQLTEIQTDNPMIITSVDTGQHRIRLAALHALSPTSRQRLQIRNQQLKEVSGLLQPSELPTIVTGDFNCTPWSPFLRDFLRTTGLRDSRQGFGYLASWHARIALLRLPIDHAFVSDKVSVHRRWVAGAAGSDHFPIVMDFSVSD